MTHTIEPALSGRAKCRACGRPIGKGELRVGERLPNPFADDKDMTIWLHLPCAAYKRPEVLLEALEASTEEIERREWLSATAREGVEHRRLPRVDGAERASTSRASCRSCHDKIPKGDWRIRLVFFDEGRFEPSGFLHAACATEYFGTSQVIDRSVHFGDSLAPDDEATLRDALTGAPGDASSS